jgi:5-methylcytosine-specific restriction protein A
MEDGGRMSREIPEWRGKDDNEPVPSRVRLRVFDKYEGRCMCGCYRKIWGGYAWQCDHIVALINGGENRESNLQPLLIECHEKKTADDVDEKSKVYRIRQKHHGLKPKRKWRWA